MKKIFNKSFFTNLFAIAIIVTGYLCLQMMGGEQAFVPLKEPFINKMKLSLTEMAESERFTAALQQGLDAHKIGGDLIEKVETVIDKRLEASA